MAKKNLGKVGKKSKGQLKAAKSKIEKLNLDEKHIAEIHQALAAQPKKPIHALDVKTLKKDLKRDEQDKKVEQDIKGLLGNAKLLSMSK